MRTAWIDAWASRLPGCDPAGALSIAEPLAHLAYAVRYQEFLDGIEPSERIYHLGDPAAAIRAALRTALTRSCGFSMARMPRSCRSSRMRAAFMRYGPGLARTV